MIDPVETVVTFLRSTTLNATLDGRIVAGRALYGDVWQLGQAALTVRPSGGDPDAYVPVRVARLEMRCWGPSEQQAYAVYLELASVAARTGRQGVALTSGDTALLHQMLEASGPSLIWDGEVQAWSVVVFYVATVGEHPTS